MATEQRIIGGGLLFVGLLILVILLYLFGGGGLDPREAYDRLAGEIWPAWKSAEEKRDYDAMRSLGKDAYGIIEDAGRARMIKYVQPEATTDKDKRRLQELIEKGGFGKNAEGLYELAGKWYPEPTHAALLALTTAVDGKLKNVREIRRIAAAAEKAVRDARDGARQPLELPEARPGPAEGGALPADNPVFTHDRELYRVFGLGAEALEAALKTPKQTGAAVPPRLRWNRDVAAGPLSGEIAGVPQMAEDLVSLAAEIELQAGRVAREGNANQELKDLLRRAAVLLGEGLTGAPRETYFADLAPYQDAASVAHVLHWEAGILADYLTTIRPLAPLFAVPFEQE